MYYVLTKKLLLELSILSSLSKEVFCLDIRG